MKFLYKKAFLKKFNRYNSGEQTLIISADREIRQYCLTLDPAPYGLRIKKLYDNGQEKTFEARVSDKIRILWVESKNLVSFVFLGSHDEVRRYIKSFR